MARHAAALVSAGTSQDNSKVAGVFISYRRADSAYALLLYKAFSQRFGRERVFRDFENIEPGQDFVAALDGALAQCAACVVIIGGGWLAAFDRLKIADDFVRREITAALTRGTLVIPCLVGGSKMPAPAGIPESLAPLLRRDAVTIGDEYFDRDVDILLNAVDAVLSRAPAATVADTDESYRQLRAVELLKRQVSRLQVRAVELIQANEVDRALDELSEGFDVIMQLIEWSPGDLPLDLQLGYMYKTLGQALEAAGNRIEANRYLDLALAMFGRVANAGTVQVNERAGALNGLGNIHYQRGNLDDAIRSYQLALELAPGYAYAWHDLLGALLLRARAGPVDISAMDNALTRLRSTGAGLPGLGAAHMGQLQAQVDYWRASQAVKRTRETTGARTKKKEAGRRSRHAPRRTR